ncbi:MAG: FAD-dependent oxidoreductase [Chloroflexi bacterium]|nr:FAD-dependent oxidoreductase [Chloroflexota bacterium]
MTLQVERKKRLEAPCTRDCPANIDVPRYIGLIEQGEFAKAVAVVRERIPFPSVCGHVCYRPCEIKCRRVSMDAPVAINALKRAATDYDAERVWRRRWGQTVAPDTGKRVAIVGSGPTGLTAAYYLGKRCGHRVTVFEAEAEPGGQLRIGIPAYRLPRSLLDEEIRVITETRVELYCNSRVDSLEELWAQGFHAIFLASGAGVPRKLGLPGENLPGVLDCVEFLAQVNLGQKVALGPRVAVIGAGNVAIDGARTARRLGGEQVAIVYRRTRDQMPAYDFEVKAAEEEGVQLVFLAAPVAFAPRGNALAMELELMKLGEPDSSGRPRPVPTGQRTIMETDTVLAAIGQVAAPPQAWSLKTNRDGTAQVDAKTLETGTPALFAGGDLVTGPLNVIEAIANGRRAAITIDRYLGGSGDISEQLAPDPEEGLEMPASLAPLGVGPLRQRELDHHSRTGSFDEVDLGLTAEAAVSEARRCIRCDLWRLAGVPSVWPKGKKLPA